MNELVLDNPILEARLSAIGDDGIFLYGLANASLRLALVHGSRAVATARLARDYDAQDARSLGEALLLGGLVASTLKGGDRVSISLDSGAAAPRLLVEAGADGSVRGYLGDKAAIGPEGSNPLPPPSLVIVRSIAGAAHPFVGRIALVTGGLAANIAEYFRQSEQTPSAARVELEFDSASGSWLASAAFVQALPGSDAATFEVAARALALAQADTLSFASGAGPDAIARALFPDHSPERLGERAFRWFCPCSKERFAATLAGLGEGLRDLVERGPWPVETTCAACGSRYHFERDELAGLLARVESRA